MSVLGRNNTMHLHSTCVSPSKLLAFAKPLVVSVAPNHRGNPTITHAAVAAERMRMRIPPPAHPTYDIKSIIKEALLEDAGGVGDVTSLATIPTQVQAEAQFLAKDSGVIAGIEMANLIFEEVDPSLQVKWNIQDGDLLTKGLHFGSVSGSARSILLAERIVLNFMQRMSGIATLTKAMAEAAKPARILETRKTVPGLRLIDKWAVLIGGGENHRLGLFDMVLVKDNHIAVAGGVAKAIAAVAQHLKENNLNIGVEVKLLLRCLYLFLLYILLLYILRLRQIETRTLEEVKEVLAHKGEGLGCVTRIMLDNMVVPLPDGSVDVSMLKQAIELINGQLETEASGNVTLGTAGTIGSTGVTFISSGALTHSVKALDISLNIDTELALAVGRRTKRM